MLSRVHSVLPDSTERVIERVIGCALEVHRELGPGYLEKIYHKAFEIELALQGLSCRAELPMGISYKGHALHGQRIDLIVDSAVVVEVKAVARLEPIHESQVCLLLALDSTPGWAANQFQYTLAAPRNQTHRRVTPGNVG